MSELDDDPILGKYFDSAEKKAKWLVRLKIAYILWIIFLITGIVFLLIWFFMK